MQLRMWMVDIAREQAPTYEHLRRYLDTTREGGYNAIGLYLEHRFAYPSTPWAHGKGAVTPDMIERLQRDYADIQIIPFVNLLGHYEGMLYTEYGKRYREELFKGMQADPSNPAFVELAGRLIDDTISIFTSEIIHIGGDETWQLGKCPRCEERVKEFESNPNAERQTPNAPSSPDGKALLYGNHFGPLAERVVKAGRRPAVWGDMFFDHPQALELMPKETLIFDWRYFKGNYETSKELKDRGFEVVGSPAIHTYNATWCHLPQSEMNVRQVAQDSAALGLYGVCVTTWECGLFGNYETLFPAVVASGKILGEQGASGPSDEVDYKTLTDAPAFLAEYRAKGEAYGEWAKLMGCELQAAGGTFAFGGIRSSLKVRLLLNANPFLAWLHHQEELTGEVGDRALGIIERAIQVAPDVSTRGVSEFAKAAIEFVRFAVQARQAYAQELPGVAIASLSPCRQIFDNLAKTARATHLNIGGSLADIERCRVARDHVETVIRRIKEFGDGSLGYLPAFEHLTHPKFMPHDQAAWWLINSWANQ